MHDFCIVAGGWTAAGLTIFIFSFLYEDNPLFRIAENLYVGVGIGYVFSNYLFNSYIPKIYVPLASGNYTVLLPLLLGLSVLTQFFPKIAWLSRYGFTFIMGYGAGIAIPASLATNLLSQLEGTARPLFVSGGPAFFPAQLRGVLSSLIIAAALVTVLVYFFFSAERRGAVKKLSDMGVYFLMIYFGAGFGTAVMGRFSLLYGRFSDLRSFSSRGYFYATPVLICAAVVYFAVRARFFKNTAGNGERGA